MGVNRTRADVHIVPLSEGFRQAQGNNTVLFSIVKSPEREPLYQWAGPVHQSQVRGLCAGEQENHDLLAG